MHPSSRALWKRIFLKDHYMRVQNIEKPVQSFDHFVLFYSIWITGLFIALNCIIHFLRLDSLILFKLDSILEEQGLFKNYQLKHEN